MPQTGTAISPPDFDDLNGMQRAAIVMLMLGEEQAAVVLGTLSSREVRDIGSAMYSLHNLNQETVAGVLDVFVTTLGKQTNIGLDSGTYIQNVMTKALGSDKAQVVLKKIAPAAYARPIEILDWMNAQSIKEVISEERPQIAALVIANLDHALAAEVLALMPENLQTEIITRIALLETVQPEAIQDLERVMQRKFEVSTSLRSSQFGGVKTAAKIMSFTNQAAEKKIFGDIIQSDKDLVAEIKDNMFIFDNLAGTDNRSLQILLRGVDSKVLVVALKGAGEKMRAFLLSGLSVRAAEDIRDELETIGPVRLSDVQAAQKEIITLARQMSDDGEIVLAGLGGEQMV